MSILNSIRSHVREHPIRMLSTTLAILIFMQVVMGEAEYHRFSVAAIAFVFAFKSWVNLVFSMTTHRQRGETDLSMALERYFWSLLGQSVVFTILFLFAALSGLSPNVPQADEFLGVNMVVVRNAIRTIAIVSVISVIIYGDQTLEALKDYIRQEKEHEVQGHRGHPV